MSDQGTKVGSIYAELSIDDARFQSTLASARTGFTSLQQAAQRAAGEVDASFRQTGQHVDRAGTSAQGASREVGRIGGAAQGASREVGRIGDAAQGAARDVGRVGDAARGAAGDVGRVGDAARDAARDVGRVEQAAQSAADAARDAAGALDDVAGAAQDAGSAAGGDMGGSFVGQFGSRLQGLAGKGGPIAAALVGVAGIGLAAGAALASALADGMETERSRDMIQARLGASDDTMRVLGAAAAGAFSAGWGESISANMDTLAAAMQGGVLSGEETAAEMQPVVEQLTAITDLMGEDMAKTIQAVRALMLNGLAPDTQTAMDLITKSFQRGGNIGEDLLDSVREYSNGWKNAGFSAQFSLGLINQALANGADWADRPADAIREFGRRMTEESDTIKESIGAINDEVEGLALPVDDLFERLKAGGPDAEAAFDEIFDAIRRIEDPLARNEIVMGLLGDTAGDFIDAFGKWDPSEAAAEMQDFAGAAENAMRVMGSNSAASFDQAKNSIVASADEIKLAMAQAFGPALQDAANWVSTHKPEILAFFTQLADAGFATLDALLAFGSGALRAFAEMQEGIGDALGAIMPALGGFAGKLGEIIQHIPGMEDTGKALVSVGETITRYGEIADGAADKAREFADGIDAARPKLDEMRESVRTTGEQAAHAAEMTRLFGGEVVAVPDGKSVLVEALTDDARQRLLDFGFQVENLQDGTSRITADTAEGQRIIDDFVAYNDGRRVDMEVITKFSGAVASGSVPATRADGGIDVRRYASGKLPDQATIKPATAHLVQWAEPETEGEAYIPLALAKRRRSTAILADVAARFGFQLFQRFADGGIRGDELEQQVRGIEGAQYVWGGWDESWNTDCTGAVSKVANLIAYGDPMVGGRFATGNIEGALAARGFLPGAGPDGSVRVGWVHDPNMPGGGHAAVTLEDGTNVEMGGERGNGQFGGKAAGWMDFPNVMHYPMPPSVGEGAPRKYKAKPEDFNAENDPDGLRALTEAGDFTDRFAKRYGKAEDDPIVAAFLRDDYDTEVDPAKLTEGNDPDGLRALMGAGDFTDRFGRAYGVTEDDPLVDALLTVREDRKRAAEQAKAEAEKSAAPRSSSGGVQDVRVTNWPPALGGSDGGQEPKATVTARWFADGTEDHRAQIAAGGDLRVWAEPETGGEAYIPLAAAKRARSTAILAAVANRFGFQLSRFALGGFGGLGSSGDGGVHTGSWELASLGEQASVPLSTAARSVPLAVLGQGAYRALALGAGLALTAASGWDENGKFQGFDTGNTSIPGLDAGLDRLSEQLTVLIEAVRDGKPVDVLVDIDSGRRTAELNITQRGV